MEVGITNHLILPVISDIENHAHLGTFSNSLPAKFDSMLLFLSNSLDPDQALLLTLKEPQA